MQIQIGFNPLFTNEYKAETIPNRSLRIAPEPPREYRIETNYRPATPEEKRFVQNRINTENARKELLYTIQQEGLALPFDLQNYY
jgi:hypothetical protein